MKELDFDWNDYAWVNWVEGYLRATLNSDNDHPHPAEMVIRNVSIRMLDELREAGYIKDFELVEGEK